MSFIFTYIFADGPKQNPKQKKKKEPSLSKEEAGLPSAYRDSAGFAYSASGQLDPAEYPAMFGYLKEKHYVAPEDILIIDLREEEHCFMNGKSVAYGMETPEQTRPIAELLGKHIGSEILYRPWEKGEAEHVKITSLITEEQYVLDQNADYLRLRVQDHSTPDTNGKKPEVVDKFISTIRVRSEQGSPKWMHFHCHGGKGRTSSFLAMLVLMQLQLAGKLPPGAKLLPVLKENLDAESYHRLTKNYNPSSAASRASSPTSTDDEASTKKTDSGADSPSTVDGDSEWDKVNARIEFLEKFLEYVQHPSFNAGAPYSEWLQKNNKPHQNTI